VSDDKAQWEGIGGRTVRPRIVDEQRDALLRLRGILEGILEKEQKKLKVVQEQLHRMKHGGGS
jgi:hypothetical protein